MLNFFHKYAANFCYSQNGEEGVLAECQRRGISIFHCVEIGGHDGRFCSNTAYVIESDIRVVTGLFVEADYNLYQQCVSNWKHNPLVRCQCSRVDGNNINAFVGDDCDLLSIDVDGADFRIFAGLKAKPKIVIMEIDSSIPPTDPSFNSDGAAGYFRGVELGLEKGFFLLVHTGNVLMVSDEYRYLFPDIIGDGLSNSDQYFNTAWLNN